MRQGRESADFVGADLLLRAGGRSERPALIAETRRASKRPDATSPLRWHFEVDVIAGLLPVVGVPMPLLSYGGTAAVSLLAGMGVVMSVRAHAVR